MITGHRPFPFFCAGLTVSQNLLFEKTAKNNKRPSGWNPS